LSDVDFGVMLPVMVPSGPRPLPFYHALQYRYGGLDMGVVREATMEAERLGYHSVWVSDHLSREVCRERLECWTTMTWLATLTEQVRLGSMVICNLYRHPGLMAKMASTLDLVSRGRLELGIGACWSELECTERGLDWPTPEARLQMLGESVRIIKSLWTQEHTDFEGRHYTLKDVYSEPKVAKYGDRSNFGGSLTDVKRRMGALRRHCEDVGRDYDEITKSTNLGVIVHPTREEYLEDMWGRWEANRAHEPFEEWLGKAEGAYIAGTPDECVEQLRPYVELGVGLFVIRFGDIPSLDGLRLFSEKVAPHF
jgi:alkanesulfonate monooxygenase SsuD/methylene tetrahydromethanopterin reductase-like flavin-dependent oxidoreductase (luciferase family)